MKRIELAVVLGLVLLLAAPAAALFSTAARAAGTARCAHNLSDLYKMQMVYTTQFGGRKKRMPEHPGEAFWLFLSRTEPPLIDREVSDIFRCPVRAKDEGWGTCDYRGPAAVLAGMPAAADPVGADLDGNHGAGKGGMVLVGSGDVTEVGANDALWKLAATATLTWRSGRPAGDETVAALIQGLKDADPKMRWGAAGKLADKGAAAKDAAGPLAGAAAGDPSFMVQMASYRALGRMGAPAVPSLVALLRDQEPAVAAPAADELFAMGTVAKDAVPALLQLLPDRNAESRTRGAAAAALGAVGAADGRTLPALLLALKSDADQLVSGAAVGLGKVGAAAVPSLIKVVKEGSGREKLGAVSALGGVGPAAKDAVPVLLPLLKSKDEEEARAAIEAVERIGPGAREALPILTELLSQPMGPQHEALGAVVKVAPEKAVATLISLLQNLNLQSDVVWRLGELGPAARDALPALQELLNKTADRSERDPIQRSIDKINGR